MIALLASALAVALLVVVLVLVRARSSAAERLGRVVHRFAGQDDADRPLPGEADFDGYGLDDWLSHLESIATTAAMSANLAERDMARWQVAMNMLPLGVLLTDEEGNVCASNAQEIMSARDAMALVGAAVRELLEEAQIQAGSRTVRLTGPPPRVIEISAHPLERDSKYLGAVAVIADRTEGVRVDDVRRDFVANLSHELRTPVGAISLLSETLASEEDPAVRTRLVDRIGAEADRMQLIIADLLELSRVEMEGSMRPEAVPVVPLLGEVAHQYSEHARKHEVELVCPDESEILFDEAVKDELVVQGDRSQLLRAVGNLVDNAIKYSDPGAQVRLSAVRQDAQTCSIVVADEGIGIPADETERVFERFYRVDKARARATGGTGLGLAIVRHVVANHGGQVMLQSREGVGTTFTLKFPAPESGT